MNQLYNTPMNQKRAKKVYRYLSIIFFLLCIAIVYYAPLLGAFRGFIGDVIIMMLLFSLAKSFFDIQRLKLIVSLFLLAVSIEILQYLKIGEVLGYDKNFLFRLIFGSIFDILDIGAYFLGSLIIFLFDRFLEKK